MAKNHSADDKERWAESHFRPVSNIADNVELEEKLRTVCVKGARFIEKLAVGTNRHLHRFKNPNIYFLYFINQAKPTKLNTEKFQHIASSGGVKFTNEYQYATCLRPYVSEQVWIESKRLANNYGANLP